MAEAVVANDGAGLHDGDERRSSQDAPERRTLTDVEVAVRLGVSRFTVRSWRLKGVGPRFLKMGRAVRYRPEDVREYEQRVLVNPASR